MENLIFVQEKCSALFTWKILSLYKRNALLCSHEKKKITWIFLNLCQVKCSALLCSHRRSAPCSSGKVSSLFTLSALPSGCSQAKLRSAPTITAPSHGETHHWKDLGMWSGLLTRSVPATHSTVSVACRKKTERRNQRHQILPE